MKYKTCIRFTMLAKITFISIFVAVCFRSAQAVASVTVCINENDLLDKARQMPADRKFAIVITNNTYRLPDWMKARFENAVDNILVVNTSRSSNGFGKTTRFFKFNGNYPTLYAVQNGFLLLRKLQGSGSKAIGDMLSDIRNLGSHKSSGIPFVEDFEKALNPPAEEADEVSPPAANKKRGGTSQLDLNTSPPRDDDVAPNPGPASGSGTTGEPVKKKHRGFGRDKKK